MSIINNANPGSNIEALYALDRAITKYSQNDKNKGKRLSIEGLLGLIAPSNFFLDVEKLEDGEFKRLANPEKKAKETLKFWGNAGLWDMAEDSVRSNFDLDHTNKLPERLLKLIASKEYDILNGNDIEPFVRFITFFLGVEEVTFVGQQALDGNKAGDLVARLIDASAVSNAMSLNSNERPTFLAYADMMGFLEQIDKKSYFVDPTRAIKTFLPTIFEESKNMFFDEFLAKLNNCFPVFDEGKYRVLVEQQMILDNDNWNTEKGIKLSASLSIAVERLIREHVIICEPASDSVNRYNLTLPNGREKTFSTIQFLGDNR
ncbi:protein DpdG [Vibrio atlanticus]|uniref:protein DpdG n=1 Tax=Vibrio atlanticus TaxID=693153 RepID=UPI00354E06A6